jgi:hypothetical protein
MAGKTRLLRSARGYGKPTQLQTIAVVALAGLAIVWLLNQTIGFFGRPSGQRPSAQDVGQKTGREPGLRLVLATHNRLFWYEPATQQQTEVHHDQVRAAPLYAASTQLLHAQCHL